MRDSCSPVVPPFEALRNGSHNPQGCSGSLWIAKVSGDLSTALKGKGKGIFVGMSLCSVELQRGVEFVASEQPLFVEIPVVTCVKEKMEPDRLKVLERDSCFVPLSMIYVPCLPSPLCLGHIGKALDKYPSGMEFQMSKLLVQNHGKVSHFLQRDILEQPGLVEGPYPWQGGEMR